MIWTKRCRRGARIEVGAGRCTGRYAGGMLKILHVGLGPLGRAMVADLHGRGLGEVVGAVDTDAALAGRRLSELVPGAGRAVRVAGSLESLGALRGIDAAVVTTSSDVRACEATFEQLLGRGLPVVSTCEELVWPWLRHAALARRLDRLARRRGGRLLGTGVNPGMMMDALPVFATAVCRRVRSIEVHRFQDASTRRIPFQRKIGAGLSRREFAAGVRAGWLRHVGLGESMHLIAACMGWRIDRWSESIGPMIAARAMRCGLGPIGAGRARGVRQTARAQCGGRVVIRMDFRAAIGLQEPEPQDRVIVRGEPDLDVVYRGGVHGDVATSAITLNCLGPLMAAAPGLHTMASIALPRWAPGR